MLLHQPHAAFDIAAEAPCQNDLVQVFDAQSHFLQQRLEPGKYGPLGPDEIVDIVDDTLNIQVASENPGVLGSAIVRGHATEIIDVGHFLPLAFEDWFRRREQQVRHRPCSVLLVDDSPFFLNMLTPVLQAAGYVVTTAASARDALALLSEGQAFDVAITDIEMPDMDGFQFAESVRCDPRIGNLPIIALSSVVSPEAIERGRRVGFHDYVAKFDRQGLIAALKEQTGVVQAA
jgi:two-component system chemotaxis sensor kinase CheA